MFVALKDGSIRNAYTVRLLNKELETRRFALTIEGVENADIEVVGDAAGQGRTVSIEVGPDRTLEARVLITRHGIPIATDSVPLTFVIRNEATGETVWAIDKFRGPHK